jgi:hypothetical protein
MVPPDSRRVSRVPRYSGATRKRIAISNTGLSPSLAGLSRPFSYRAPSLFKSSESTDPFEPAHPLDYCGPSTPSSPCESLGLACSAFARHYLRNRGCFLFLEVLRWFTSLGSLRTPMCSAHGNECLHSLGSPIRIFPDHSLLAAPRDFSQLATSFFACPRQGIHTHALSSLTIKLAPLTECRDSHVTLPPYHRPLLFRETTHGGLLKLVL